MALLGNNQSSKFEKQVHRLEGRDGGLEVMRTRVTHIEQSIINAMKTPVIMRATARKEVQPDVYAEQPTVKIPMDTVATVEAAPIVDNGSLDIAAVRQRIADTHEINLPG